MRIRQGRLGRQSGFTLIELISVIIILGILAAVITPKYFDMVDKAQDAAYKGALAEGVARINMAYGSYILNNNEKPTDLATLQTNSTYLGSNPVNIGDYNLTYGGTDDITITLCKKGTSTALQFSNSTDAAVSWPWPN